MGENSTPLHVYPRHQCPVRLHQPLRAGWGIAVPAPILTCPPASSSPRKAKGLAMKSSEELRTGGLVAIAGAGPGGATRRAHSANARVHRENLRARCFRRQPARRVAASTFAPDSGQRAIDEGQARRRLRTLLPGRGQGLQDDRCPGATKCRGWGRKPTKMPGRRSTGRTCASSCSTRSPPGPSRGAMSWRRSIPRWTGGGGWTSRTRPLSSPTSWLAPTASAPRSGAA